MYSFVYNSDGLRTEKTVNGVVHTYYYSGSQLLAEEWNGNLIVFLYDANGAPIGMRYRTASYAQNVWDTYFYEKNLQGDVVAIYSETGTKLVSYTYDAWGNQTVTYHNGGASITAIVNNPLRYRSYYYDIDLGLYYLQTRYYDSNLGRFVNADSALYYEILGYNMYLYCNNNPVMYIDSTGESAVAVLEGWVKYAGLIAIIEPTFLGEIVFGVGVVAIAIAVICEAVDNEKTESDSKSQEAPKSVTESEQELDENGKPIVKKGQIPTEREGYIAPNGGPVMGKTKDGQTGWKDKNGNIWVPAPTGTSSGHGGGHWDVQSPKGGYINVYPGGKVRGGKSPLPSIPILP